MLLTDGCPNTVEELRAHESGILDVGSTELIDLKTKLALGKEDVSEWILDFLLEDGRAGDPKAGARRQVGVSDVVVTRQLKRWHALHTLAVVYRDVFHNQLNSRYEAQYAEYRKLAEEARRVALRFGVGLVDHPIPAAPAPSVSGIAGGATAGTYYVCVTWIGMGGGESAPSEMTAYEAADGFVPVVAVVGPPAGVTGFNVYASVTPEALKLQTVVPVPLGGSFTFPGSLLADGAPMGSGQAPDVYVTGAHVLRRG